ncbi:MAG TPA: hypothetical protein VH092_16560, partial [Urbifossiella sp.]|nr:hypothetical protein [Urbifossiella sp.]
MRTCVATTRDSEAFGRMVGAEARDSGAATRRAFVADGPAYNGAIQKRWFEGDTPVTDVIHVPGYAGRRRVPAAATRPGRGVGTCGGCGDAGRAGCRRSWPSWTGSRSGWG